MVSETIPILHLPHPRPHDSSATRVHAESLNTLASMFGRDMQVHRHDRHYQLHYIDRGRVQLRLGESDYIERGPLLFITPPPTPHRFITEPSAQGVVLTVHQSVVQELLNELNKGEYLIYPGCICLKQITPQLCYYKEQTLLGLHNIKQVSHQDHSEFYATTLLYWAKLIFTNLLVLMEEVPTVQPSHHSYLHVFRQYLNLIEEHYKAQPSLKFFAQRLNVTEARLNTICRAIANSSAKQLVYERIIQEAKYLLGYTSLYIKEVAFGLGYPDPAYFSRFFSRQAGITPLQYRRLAQQQAALAPVSAQPHEKETKQGCK